LPAYSQLTRLNHAKTSTTGRGIEKYVLELTFDGGAVIRAIAHRLANATGMFVEDTNEQFVLMSSAPDHRHAANQLAISYAGLIVHALLEIVRSLESPRTSHPPHFSRSDPIAMTTFKSAAKATISKRITESALRSIKVKKLLSESSTQGLRSARPGWLQLLLCLRPRVFLKHRPP
jgi:hypothetical protein